jgi:pyruvate,water dikinase
MTALPPPPLPLSRVERLQFGMMAELLPVRPYPLDMTTWVVRGHGRILVRMAQDLPGLRVDLTGILPEVDGVVDRLAPMRLWPTRRTLTALPRMVRLARRFSAEQWTADPRFAAFERDVDRLRSVAVSALPWPGLLARVDDAFAVLEGFIDLRVDYLPEAGVSLARLRLLLAVLGLRTSYGGLTAGIRTRTGDANRALRNMSELVDDPEAFASALPAYIDEYGHREVTSAFLVSQPTWAEESDLIRSAARAVAGQPTPTAERTADAELATVLARRRVRRLRIGPRIEAAAARARSGIAFREDTHFHATRLLPIVRGALVEAGERLAGAGVLDAATDVWHLRWAELTAITGPEQVGSGQRDTLRALVAERSARREAYGGAPLVSPATLQRAGPTTDALVSGNPASSGRATGPVRVVRGPEDFGRLQPGDVLVCPFTNPAWTPLFEIAVAAVVDTGSVGSHAAITAREYGIPAVMGTGNGTTVLADGQRVEVDGGTGAVRAACDD